LPEQVGVPFLEIWAYNLRGMSDEFILLTDALALMDECNRNGFPKPFMLRFVK